jgi:14-3-3 protein epsilon
MSKSYEESIYLARVAEQSDRFEDMIEFLGVLGDKAEDLTTEERNLLSVAFKNAIGQRRTAWRAVSAIGQNPKYQQYSDALTKYKSKIEGEMEKICNDIVILVDGKLISKATDESSKVFFHKMKGDYFRYLSEVSADAKLQSASDNAMDAYTKAQDESGNIGPANPIKLGLFLNMSVFHYEVRNDHKKACELAKTAFDEAINQLDNLEEEQYKDAATILQLLRDNLTLWTAENEDEGKGDGGEVLDL